MSNSRPSESVPNPFTEAAQFAAMHPGATPWDDLPTTLDHADAAFASLADTPLVSPLQDFPSVAVQKSQERSGAHLPLVSHNPSEDPGIALAGITQYPAAVREETVVSDPTYAEPRITVSWLGCATLDRAVEYVGVAGACITLPGSGEDDCTTYMRDAYQNPHFGFTPGTPGQE